MIWYTGLIVTRTCHHLSFKLKWVLSTESGTNIPPICPYRKWFGVNGTTSAGCDDWYVNGLLLIKPSAPTKAVRSSSSHHLYLHSPICFWSLFLAALTIISWTPQKCGAAGGLNDDWISLFLVVFWIFSWSSWFTKFLQSLSAFTKIATNAWKQHWEYPFDLQFSKMPLKMNQHPSWMTSPNVLHMSSDKWTSKCIVLLFLYFSLVLWWMVWHNQQQH